MNAKQCCMGDCWSTIPAGLASGMHPSLVLEPTISLAPARTHTVKSLRCAPICSADGFAALDRVRFVAGVQVSAPEGCLLLLSHQRDAGGKRPHGSRGNVL
jgi:hypothetical protein